MQSIETTSVLWEKCFGEKICVKIPFDGTKCLEASGCVRVLKKNESFYVEIELLGQRVRYELAKTCYPAYSVGIARLEVCADPKIENGNIKGLVLSANLCIGGKIDGINLEKCWKVIRSTINFFHLADFNLASTGMMQLEDDALVLDAKRAGQEYVYVEHDELEEALHTETPIIHSEVAK
jgi:uncharacterized membrane protein (Fun14 family)